MIAVIAPSRAARRAAVFRERSGREVAVDNDHAPRLAGRVPLRGCGVDDRWVVEQAVGSD